MSGEAGSDVGSPLAGAVAPSRMSDLGMAGHAPLAGLPAAADAGKPMGPGAAEPGAKMQPIPELFGKAFEPKQIDESEIDPNAPVELEALDEQTEQQQDGQLTPEQQLAKYNEWMDSDQIPEEFQDRPIWVPDGKGGQVPIKLRDIHNNVLLYNDYQKKTTEVAQMRRQNEAYAQGRQRWTEDMNSGNADLGLRAIRGIGAEKTLEAICIKYIQNMAALEKYDPADREMILRGQRAQDEAFYLRQQEQIRQQQEQQAREREAAEQGINAPDVKYTQEAVAAALPDLQKQLQAEDPLIDYILSGLLAEAATGTRDAQGQWIKAPVIQLGRAPSREVLTQLVLAAKQQAQGMQAAPGKRLTKPTPAAKPIPGTGPAAKPGQRGNLSKPKQSRFSDLATTQLKR